MDRAEENNARRLLVGGNTRKLSPGHFFNERKKCGKILTPAFLALSETVAYSACMKKIVAYIQKLAAENFFGTVTLSFQNGRVCNIKVERSLKPEDL